MMIRFNFQTIFITFLLLMNIGNIFVGMCYPRPLNSMLSIREILCHVINRVVLYAIIVELYSIHRYVLMIYLVHGICGVSMSCSDQYEI